MLRSFIGLLLAAAVVPCANAAQSYDNCTGVITTLPATISTQGTWCLKSNLSTAITTGNAITVATNNVTIDCNDYKLGGLPAGDATNAVGIFSADKLNTTVRRCGIRGFSYGILLSGANNAGTLIEDNRFDQNTYRAIEIHGGGHVIQRNRIVDTGGRPNSGSTVAIQVTGSESQVNDNLISGLMVTNAGGLVVGINATGGTSEISRNMVTGLVPNQGPSRGITVGNSKASTIRSNVLLSGSLLMGYGVNASAGNVCSENKIIGYNWAFVGGCTNGGNNSSRK
ncbi:right-handed parallel beta-helix repeat-containing protein [Agrilutibacter solisilvae]|uniref:Right handed beta helix domain-containing protein n=1 Tax=Agrilutibacter solisilvae TaxID=2763317 RepID=A0A975ATN5_9GAMM|nr:hypothetical protein [Lysobacter solisilvae]QSX79284.1 hypothetical protein I8J32_005225 [Lysobacter solisilvae]